MSAIATAAIAAGASLGNTYASAKMNKKTRQMTVEENKKNRQFNWDMFHATNEYNNATNQMARLKAAGINPHLAYSQGHMMNTSNANSSLGTQPVSAGNQPPQFDIGTVLSALRMESEIKNIDADTEKKQSETRSTETINSLNAMDLENKATDIALNNSIKGTQVKEGESRIALNEQNIKKAVQETINAITQNEALKKDIELKAAQKGYTEQQTANLIATLGLIRAQEANTYASANLSNQQAKTEGTKRSNIEADTAFKSQLIKKASTENFILEKTGYGTAQNNERESYHRANKALNDALGSEKENVLKDLRVTSEELLQWKMRMDVVDKGLDMVNPVNRIMPKSGKSSRRK